MAVDNPNFAVPVGSGRVRLPARLSKTQLGPDGYRLPKKTTTQRNALSLGTAGEGTVLYDDTLNKAILWNGTTWVNMDGTTIA